MAALHFLWAETWSVLLVVAFIGWGHLVLRALGERVPSLALSACVGVAAAVFIGGLLNLLHLITGGILMGWTLVGLALALILRSGRGSARAELAALFPVPRGAWGWRQGVVLCFVLLFIFRLASTPRVSGYNAWDDEPFYLAAPVKMMEVHQVAADPFSERRIEGSVGANFFLQGLVLSTLPLENIQMADRSVGLILMVLVTLTLARQFQLSEVETALLGIFSICIPPYELNLTFVVIPSALFPALVLIGIDRGLLARPAAQALLVGLMAGLLCSVKSTYLPHAAVFCLALYLLWGFQKGWKFAVKGWMFALLGALLVLIPWMIAMRLTSGTFLYPMFGPGYDFPAYHQFPLPSTATPLKLFTAAAPYVLPLAGIIFIQVFILPRDERSLVFLALALACLAGTVATDLATGGNAIKRYNFPVVMPLAVLTYLLFSWHRRLRPEWKPGYFLQTACVAVLLLIPVVMEFVPDYAAYATMWGRIQTSFADAPNDSLEIRQEYAKISSALPRDTLVLTTLAHPYLLDHLDRRILLADWPGCAGLPPGWPIRKDSEALAAFLLGQSIRYVAFSYAGNEELTDIAREKTAGKFPSFGVWLRVQCESYLLANKQYMDLKRSRRAIYDDGKVAILDLSTRV